MKFLIALVIALALFAGLCIVDRKIKGNMNIMWKIFSVLLVIVFIAWNMLPGNSGLIALGTNAQAFFNQLFRSPFELGTSNSFGSENVKAFVISRVIIFLTAITLLLFIFTITIKFIVPTLINLTKVEYTSKAVVAIVATVIEMMLVPNIFVLSMLIFGTRLVINKLVFSFANLNRKEAIAI